MRNEPLASEWKFLHRPPTRKSPFTTHPNTPLTPTGQLRLAQRHLTHGIPQAHVATWVTRYLQDSNKALIDPPSTPATSPPPTPPEAVEHIEALPRNRKWSAPRIWHHLAAGGCNNEKSAGPFHAPVIIALPTVGR